MVAIELLLELQATKLMMAPVEPSEQVPVATRLYVAPTFCVLTVALISI